eukprot:CAMPEP_0184328214 /NCGR_PEP_ID=MMETSP1049-20130417/143504_1 /TAXON_ID=77928 /ORGANISM="Proteomonas sulcata, Strain CCMP704" /LENGTH=35 /DNA_ID= /DNA_START= /DNA_END= /DNA_ORIENTATION=
MKALTQHLCLIVVIPKSKVILLKVWSISQSSIASM